MHTLRCGNYTDFLISVRLSFGVKGPFTHKPRDLRALENIVGNGNPILQTMGLQALV
jgi:hypothetical protein